MTANRLLAYGARRGAARELGRFSRDPAFGNGVVIHLASQLMPLAASRGERERLDLTDCSEKILYRPFVRSRHVGPTAGSRPLAFYRSLGSVSRVSRIPTFAQ